MKGNFFTTFLVLFFNLSAILFADSFIVEPTPLSEAFLTSPDGLSIASTINSSGDFLIQFANTDTNQLYYAITNGSTSDFKVPVTPVPEGTNGDLHPIPAANSLGDFMIAFVDKITDEAFVGITDGSSSDWKALPAVFASDVKDDSPQCLASPTTGDFIIVWVDNSNNGHYAVTNGSSLWKISPTTLPGGVSNVIRAINVSVNSLGDFLLSWVDNSNNAYYGIIDGSNPSVWKVNPLIVSSSVTVSNVLCSASTLNTDFILSWIESGDLYYAITNGSTSGFKVPATQVTGATQTSNIMLTAGTSGDFLLSWVNSSDEGFYAITDGSSLSFKVDPTNLASDILTFIIGSPSPSGDFRMSWTVFTGSSIDLYYAITDGSSDSWKVSPTTVPSALEFSALGLLSAGLSDNFLLGFYGLNEWPAGPSTQITPYYAIYGQAGEPPAGRRVQVRALLQKIWANDLTWGPITGAAFYRIYADAALTKLLYQGTETRFVDPNINTNQTQTYYLVSVNSSGTQSSPTTIVVR